MSVITFIIFVFAIFIAVESEPITRIVDLGDTRIISGSNASPGQFPFLVAIEFTRGETRYFCGGTLICDYWVLTSAQCAKDVTSLTLTFGATNRCDLLKTGGFVLNSNANFIHPQYKPPSFDNDIALIRLPKKINIGKNVGAVSLSTYDFSENITVTTAGWGRTSDNVCSKLSPIINYVQLKTISNEECQKTYGPKIVSNQIICCIGEPEHNPCTGDTGGPLIFYREGKAFLIGITSFTSSSICQIKHPYAFTRVASYLPWIKQTIGETCNLVVEN